MPVSKLGSRGGGGQAGAAKTCGPWLWQHAGDVRSGNAGSGGWQSTPKSGIAAASPASQARGCGGRGAGDVGRALSPGAAGGAKQPLGRGCSSVGSGWKWSLDPVKVCRGLLFAQGTPKEQSKGCCRSRRSRNKHGAPESLTVSAAGGIGVDPGAGCACGRRGVGGGGRRRWLCPGNAAEQSCHRCLQRITLCALPPRKRVFLIRL